MIKKCAKVQKKIQICKLFAVFFVFLRKIMYLCTKFVYYEENYSLFLCGFSAAKLQYR